MSVHFVGAGPGAADLITLRAQRLLASCSVCLYAGSLVPAEVLAHCPPDARLIDTRDLTLDDITAELVAAERRGEDVVRLCSGDPSIYSAMAEQFRRLDAAGVGYDVTPGVPAFAAAAASLKRELTVPTVAQSVVLTRFAQRATPMPAGETVATHASPGTTMVLHLAVQAVDEVVASLLPGYGPDVPVAVVAQASRDTELVLRGTLSSIAAQVHEAGVTRTAVIVVGHALAAEGFADSHLYSCERDRSR